MKKCICNIPLPEEYRNFISSNIRQDVKIKLYFYIRDYDMLKYKIQDVLVEPYWNN